MTNVFVYGTLRMGEYNSPLLGDARLIGDFKSAAKYTMYDINGGFPAIIGGGSTQIVGEVYEVDDATLARLDRLEGHPNFYRRDPIDVEGFEGEVIAYFMPRAADYPVITSGDWVNRAAATA